MQAPLPIYVGELNNTPLGDLRLAASDFGLVAVEWADSQVHFDAYLNTLFPYTTLFRSNRKSVV